jgi:hypothetical protein
MYEPARSTRKMNGNFLCSFIFGFKPCFDKIKKEILLQKVKFLKKLALSRGKAKIVVFRVEKFTHNNFSKLVINSVGKKAGRLGPRFRAELARVSILYGNLIKGFFLNCYDNLLCK